MLIRYGFDIELDLNRPSTLVTALDIHPERRADVVADMVAPLDPGLKLHTFFDAFGNFCRRIESKAGGPISLRLDGLIRDSGQPDPVLPWLTQTPLADLPDDTLRFLAPTRYCDSDRLGDFALMTFGAQPRGWAKVEAICDFVQERLVYDEPSAQAGRTASQILEDGSGGSSDFAHLAIALCRASTLPARYCHGYLPSTGRPGFQAWFEVYLRGNWHIFDARHNEPRSGRILVARGRDAADIPMINTFGGYILHHFEVTTEEVAEAGRLVAVA
jgi:transglutaminase-like putative cysteine protease